MAWTFLVNQAVPGYSDCMATFINFLLLHGWTVPAALTNSLQYPVSEAVIYKPDAPNFDPPPYSGPQPSSFGQQAPFWTNVVFNPSPPPDVLVHPQLQGAPASLATALRYVVIQQPGSTRQFCFQRSAAVKFSIGPDVDSDWRITYSPGGLFVNSGSGSTAPSATDSVILLGGGTEASPTFTTVFNDLNIKLHLVFGDSEEQYSCACFCTSTAGAVPSSGNTDTYGRFAFVVDMVRGAPGADPDPCVIYIGDESTVGMGDALRVAYASSPISLIGSSYQQTWLQDIGGTFPAGIPVNPLTGKETLTVPSYARPHTASAPRAFKGYSTVFKYKGVARVSLDTFNLNGSKDLISVGAVALPWNGSDPPHTAGGNADAELIFPPPTASGKKYFLACHDSATPPHRVYWVGGAVDISQAPTPPNPPLVTSTLTVLSSL